MRLTKPPFLINFIESCVIFTKKNSSCSFPIGFPTTFTLVRERERKKERGVGEKIYEMKQSSIKVSRGRC